MMDNYVEIKGYSGYYINKDGEVISHKRKKPRKLKPHIKGNGYIEYTLSPSKYVYKQIGVHRLLAEAFIPKVDGKEQVNHINGDITDNRLENLEWVSASENILHSIYVLGNRKHTQRKMWVDGKQFESMKECAEYFGISAKNLSSQLAKGIMPRKLRGKNVIVE